MDVPIEWMQWCLSVEARLGKLETQEEAPTYVVERNAVRGFLQLRDALEGIFDAIDDPGGFPAHHEAILDHHQVEWPTLWERIDTARKLYEEVVAHE